ncbi:hypothetical protein BGZ81_000592 [Podila clonocystis]|nr:hypothetical protein BGZ81_000592 [Podila clonocystis]
MNTSIRYATTCIKVALPSEDPEMIGHYAEGNEGEYSSSLVRGDQGGQLFGNPLGASLPAVPHGYPVSDPNLNISQPITLHPPLNNPPPSHPHDLYNISNNNKNSYMPIARVGEDTFVTYDDGEVYTVLASQSPSQAILQAHTHVPLANASAVAHVSLTHAPYPHALPTHGFQAPPSTHVLLTHVPYSLAFPAHELQDPPPSHVTHAPPLALGSAAAAITSNLGALTLTIPPNDPRPVSPVPANMAIIDIAKRVDWHVNNAVKIGSIWLCPFTDCPQVHVGSKDSLKHHLHRIHYRPSERLHCPVDWCSRHFGYHLDLKRHIGQAHLGIGHICPCTGRWYSRLETLKKRCGLKDKCPGAVDRRVTGASAKERGGSVRSSKH